ncbi:MAG TPA: hypothetical protein ENJ66_01090 [Calditrichae bacterium]|nr:hypothetical protein [Calditrichia bacterium]
MTRRSVVFLFMVMVGLWTGVWARQQSNDGYIELAMVHSTVSNDTASVHLALKIHFPNYTLPGILTNQSPFIYQIMIQVYDENDTLVYSRTVTRRLTAYPLGKTDSVDISFRLPVGQYRLFVTPLNIPVYIQDLTNVPLPVAEKQMLP